MSAFMLEYWDKEHWNVTLSTDPRVEAALDHGAREGAPGSAAKRVMTAFRDITPFTCHAQLSPCMSHASSQGTACIR